MLKVRCQASATLDAKGRLALPAPLRRAFGVHDVTSLVLTFNEGALWGWTPDIFESQVERPLNEQDQFDARVRHFTHRILAPAQDIEVDRQGRIRIPPLLRRLAGLDKDVMINSLGDRLEIWDRPSWEAYFEQCLTQEPSVDGMPRTS
ncbi:MAG: MraZ protein [Kiritimatiellia bacterium]|jgi:MraZ protein